MLKALYDYSVRENLALPPGFALKIVKAYICFDINGKFIGIEDGDAEAVVCPDIGSLARGTEKSNVIAEKTSVVLNENENKKSAFFRETLRDITCLKEAALCADALDNGDTLQTILSEAQKKKIKPNDRISFKVDGVSLLSRNETRSWWSEYRKQFIKNGGDSGAPCLITGITTVPLATVPPVSGLKVVGGHANGDALICFDKASFRSYDLEQSANAPVSPEAFAGVKAALDSLLKDAPILAGMKFVHWYDKSVEREDDIINFAFSFTEDEEDKGKANDADDEDENIADNAQKRLIADKAVKSITEGISSAPLADQYFILLLSGVNGRVMIRRYERGSYSELQERLDRWYDQLELVDRLGTNIIKPYKLTARLKRLMSRQKAEKNFIERCAKELSGITPFIIDAILTGSPLPDSVAARALAYIRSVMFEADDSLRSPPTPDPVACQWLKVWLMRKNIFENKEEALMDKYNPGHPSAAYHCGALMAVYAAIQNVAMPDVNAGVVQRYYVSASRTPALVLGRLDGLSKFHLGKIDNPAIVYKYEERLNDVYSSVGGEIPAILSLEEQAYFALGYHQYAAKLNAERAENAAAKKAASEDKKANVSRNNADDDFLFNNKEEE